jgi:hypothetical protein
MRIITLVIPMADIERAERIDFTGTVVCEMRAGLFPPLFVGRQLKRTAVRLCWQTVTIAE